MVSSMNIDKLKFVFEEFQKLPALDIHAYSGELMDAIFDINTVDSHLAGLILRVLDGKSITSEERSSVPMKLLGDDGKSLLAIVDQRNSILLEGDLDILTYVKDLDNMREIFLSVTK